jgi:membrane protein implicated in regulation of membrane protease activity
MGFWLLVPVERIPFLVWLLVAAAVFGYLGILAEPWSGQQFGDFAIALVATYLIVRRAIRALSKSDE